MFALRVLVAFKVYTRDYDQESVRPVRCDLGACDDVRSSRQGVWGYIAEGFLHYSPCPARGDSDAQP